jgi:hypothetical protein
VNPLDVYIKAANSCRITYPGHTTQQGLLHFSSALQPNLHLICWHNSLLQALLLLLLLLRTRPLHSQAPTAIATAVVPAYTTTQPLLYIQTTRTSSSACSNVGSCKLLLRIHHHVPPLLRPGSMQRHQRLAALPQLQAAAITGPAYAWATAAAWRPPLVQPKVLVEAVVPLQRQRECSSSVLVISLNCLKRGVVLNTASSCLQALQAAQRAG